MGEEIGGSDGSVAAATGSQAILPRATTSNASLLNDTASEDDAVLVNRVNTEHGDNGDEKWVDESDLRAA